MLEWQSEAVSSAVVGVPAPYRVAPRKPSPKTADDQRTAYGNTSTPECLAQRDGILAVDVLPQFSTLLKTAASAS